MLKYVNIVLFSWGQVSTFSVGGSGGIGGLENNSVIDCLLAQNQQANGMCGIVISYV